MNIEFLFFVFLEQISEGYAQIRMPGFFAVIPTWPDLSSVDAFQHTTCGLVKTSTSGLVEMSSVLV
jgi:hypothetical protein